jgi:hypothetical protein
MAQSLNSLLLRQVREQIGMQFVVKQYEKMVITAIKEFHAKNK